MTVVTQISPYPNTKILSLTIQLWIKMVNLNITCKGGTPFNPDISWSYCFFFLQYIKNIYITAFLCSSYAF